MKPVGQKHVLVDGTKVDKDVMLFKKWFDLVAPAALMSPVVVPSHYTREYIDGQHSRQCQVDRINQCYKELSAHSDLLLLEGTGHSGVGSVIDMNNAQVAAQLQAKVVLVGTGGLGSSFDELELNRLAFKSYGVDIVGVILNKCMPSKMDMLRHYFSRLISSRWDDVPLLGLIPSNELLGKSSLSDLKKHIGARQLSGEAYNDKHYDLHDVHMVCSQGLDDPPPPHRDS